MQIFKCQMHYKQVYQSKLDIVDPFIESSLAHFAPIITPGVNGCDRFCNLTSILTPSKYPKLQFQKLLLC